MGRRRSEKSRVCSYKDDLILRKRQADSGIETTTDAAPAPPAKENIPPVATTTAPTTDDQQAPATNGADPAAATPTPSQPAHDPASEEKVAVTMEEPPPIRNVLTAPGMSATSGPLEEFPEGGFVPGEDH